MSSQLLYLSRIRKIPKNSKNLNFLPSDFKEMSLYLQVFPIYLVNHFIKIIAQKMHFLKIRQQKIENLRIYEIFFSFYLMF